MQKLDYFNNKKITVVGLGLLGRGVGDVEFLARHGADLIVTDLKSAADLRSSLARLEEFPNVKFTLGEHRLEDFRDRDFILKAAGVPFDSIYIQEAERNNIPVEMSTALFADLSDAKIIGITGTRGKSTVTQMVFDALQSEKEVGNIKEKIWLGGNVRGVSTLALLDKVSPGDIAVLELDSWQLQGFRARGISPQISVFTTFMPDHMNYYKDDLRAYFFDKAAIYENQSEKDVLIISEVVHELMDEFGILPTGQALKVLRDGDVSSIPELSIPGEHNRQNAALAKQVLLSLGVGSASAEKHLASFEGVSGRLEKIATKNNISFYNDTAATTPEAGAAGVRALGGSEVVLIAGGSDKGLDFAPFIKTIKEGVSKLILLPGAGTDRLLEELAQDPGIEHAPVASSMSEAVSLAASLAEPGGVVLLSPGCASFGLFKNEFDRGDQFVSAVKKL